MFVINNNIVGLLNMKPKLMLLLSIFDFVVDLESLVGKWADPGGTAIPGQPVTEPEQAPGTLSPYKNQFNIEGNTWFPYQILS